MNSSKQKQRKIFSKSPAGDAASLTGDAASPSGDVVVSHWRCASPAGHAASLARDVTLLNIFKTYNFHPNSSCASS
jgi:hypothetical protein